MNDAPIKGEHELTETLVVKVYYPDHPCPRAETPTFRASVAAGKKRGDHCWVTGLPNPEYHHFFIEWADADAVDWTRARALAIKSAQPEPQELFFSDVIVPATISRGFDWLRFDPTVPEKFVDSEANLIPLHADVHRMKEKGLHMEPFPIWVMRAWPHIDGFVMDPTS